MRPSCDAVAIAVAFAAAIAVAADAAAAAACHHRWVALFAGSKHGGRVGMQPCYLPVCMPA